MENNNWDFKIYRKIRNQLVVLYFFFIAGKENYVELIKSLYWRCFSGLFYWFAYFNWPLQKVNARRDQPWAAKVGIRTPILSLSEEEQHIVPTFRLSPFQALSPFIRITPQKSCPHFTRLYACPGLLKKWGQVFLRVILISGNQM